jgi:hypothetical protein
MHFAAAPSGNDADIAQDVTDQLPQFALGIDIEEEHTAGRLPNFLEEPKQTALSFAFLVVKSCQ